MRRHLVPTLILFALAACGDDPCPAGTTPIGDTCVPADGGADSSTDSSTDADTGTDADAGPCGMACTGGTPYCDEGAGTCVACLMDSHCTALDAPECDAMGACVACTGNEACTGRTDAEVCAPDGDNAGSCVQCLDNSTCTEAMEGCNLASNSCRTYTPGSVGACGDCIADAECNAGLLCIAWTYDDPRTPVGDIVPAGNHCAWRQDASGMGAPEGDCVTISPYVRAQMTTSVDGADATFCTFRQSTCEAHADFPDTDCMTLDDVGDARCGIDGVDDGVCRMRSATTNRCTVFCLGAEDCPGGAACETGATPRVCSLM